MKLVAEVALDILGPDGLLWGDDGVDGGRYAEQFNFVRCMSIAGGSDEINKNVIGERALGLPREPDANKGLPYREVLARMKSATDLSRCGALGPGGRQDEESSTGGATSWAASTRSSPGTVTSRLRPTSSKYVPEKYKDRAPKPHHPARRRRRRVADGGHAAHLREPEPHGSREGEVRGPELLQGRRLAHRRRRRRGPAAAGAGRGRPRRRAAVRAGVRQPLPREDPRPRRVPVDGAGVQHWLSPTTARSAPDRLIGNALMPDLGHRRRDRRAGARARDRASSRCSSSTSRTAAAGPKPEDDRFWEKALELDMRAVAAHVVRRA